MKVSLTDICDFQGGTQPPKDEWIDQPAQGYVRMLQIRDFTQSDKNYIEYVKDTGKLKTCIEDDILIGRYGASIGKILTGLAGAYNVAIVKTIPDEKVVSKKYLYWYLNSQYFQRFISNVGSRAAQAGFNKNDLGAAQIPLVDKERQEEICEVLEKANKLISLRKQQLAKLDELVKARFVEMFGNPIENTMNWPKKLLRDITTKIGSGATPKGGRESYPNAGVSLIRSMNVYDGQFLYKDLAHLTDEQATQLNGVTVEAEDVLVNITGASVARSCVAPKDVLPARVNQHVAIVRCNRKLLNPIFTNKMFTNNEFKKALLSIGESGGATRQAITKKQLEELSVVVPPLSIQNEFFTFSECVDQQKQTVQQSLEKLELMKKALMQEYFG